jgi:putative hydrolase of the HAD superfamily
VTTRGVLLDVGGVLLLPGHDAVRQALSLVAFEPDDSRIDQAEYHAIRAADEAHSAGEEAVQRYWSAFARALGVPPDRIEPAVAAFQAVFTPDSRTWTQPIEDSITALRLLRAAGSRVALVSNSHDILETELRDLGICQVGKGPGANVDAIVVSGVVWIERPYRRIFDIALRALDVRPSEAVHVGDSVRFDVDGATSAGVEAFHFDPASVCERDDHEHLASLDELVSSVLGTP